MSRNELDERIETYYVRVRGVVQGVGFRHATVREAHALKLRGWVANLEDGTVEAMIQAPARRSTGCSRGCATGRRPRA